MGQTNEGGLFMTKLSAMSVWWQLWSLSPSTSPSPSYMCDNSAQKQIEDFYVTGMKGAGGEGRDYLW